MLGDVGLALAQVFDRRFLGVLAKTLAATAAILAALIAAAGFALSSLPAVSVTIPWTEIEIGFLDEAAAGLGIVAVILLSMVLMFPVAAIFVGLFLDEIADAVEGRHYPRLGPPRRQGFFEMAGQGLRFALVLVFWNGVALIVYLLSALLAPVIFLAVNGWLLGREYFELVALRRMAPAEAAALRRTHMPAVWAMGVLLALPLSIPFVSLVAPLVGVAAFVHFFHRKSGRAPDPATL